MASVIKVESFDVNVATAASTTHTLTNDVGNLADAFVRRTTSIDKQSGPSASTGNANANIACGAAYLSGTSTVSFRQDSTTSQKIIGEVWRYTGSGGGADEFIVRGRHTITLTSTTTGSASVSGISNRDNCIPFWTGASQTAATVNDYDASTVSVYIDASDNIQVERGSGTGTLVVYVTVVEFTGANWKVGHVKSASHDGANETNITMRTNSLATTGTFDVTDWSKATIIEASLEGDTSETGLSDNLGDWIPGSSTTTASFYNDQDAGTQNDGVSYAHILAHPALVVNRTTNTNFTEGNGTYTNATWPSGASTTESLDELAVEWFSDTSGTGTAHARGRLSARITAASGTLQTWVHRSGNNVRVDYGVIELANVDGSAYLNVTDVDTDEAITNSQTNVVVTGTDFEATQGTGKVELVQNNDYTGTIVNQTSIDSWSDTSIQFDVSAGALADTNCYLFVTNDTGTKGYIAVQVGTPPQTYQEAIEALTTTPGHLWTFQNTYADEIGTATANGAASGGTPAFVTSVKPCRGDTHSLELATGDYISPADQSDMNVTVTATRRYMGGWIVLDSVSQILSVIYEEGAQVNNIGFLNGFGNNLMMQVADTGDDYAQAYADVPLAPDRPYHIMIKFEASAQDAEVRMYLDGVLQARSNGNPWTATDLDTHSGNISWGHEGTEQLQVGDSTGADNVDITFASPNKCYYSHWVNWTNFDLNPTDIREVLFEKGATAGVEIDSDTEANMQTDLDVYADTERPDWPIAIKINDVTGGGDLDLEFDNITFDEKCSVTVQYQGIDTLTLTMKNGASIDEDKISTPNGGTVAVQYAVPITVTVRNINTKAVISGAYVLLEADTGGDLAAGTDLIKGATNGSGQVTTTLVYTSDQPVTGKVRQGNSPYYQQSNIAGTVTAAGFDQTILLIPDA